MIKLAQILDLIDVGDDVLIRETGTIRGSAGVLTAKLSAEMLDSEVTALDVDSGVIRIWLEE